MGFKEGIFANVWAVRHKLQEIMEQPRLGSTILQLKDKKTEQEEMGPRNL